MTKQKLNVRFSVVHTDLINTISNDTGKSFSEVSRAAMMVGLEKLMTECQSNIKGAIESIQLMDL